MTKRKLARANNKAHLNRTLVNTSDVGAEFLKCGVKNKSTGGLEAVMPAKERVPVA